VDAENSSESLEEDDDTIMDIAVSDQTATTIICAFVRLKEQHFSGKSSKFNKEFF